MKKVSVIVPVYNTEQYIERCIESVTKQNYENIELIIVNDGSTDNSEKIIKKLLNNENIKYFHKENGGLSDARNFGVEKATGDYICFLDSDDYLDKNLLENLKKYTEEDYDLIKYKLIKVDENGKQIEKVTGPTFKNKTGEESFNLLYGQDVMLQPAWLYLYKKSFWDKNKFKYPVNIFHEDFALTVPVMLKADKVCSIDYYGYYYVQSATSITRGNNIEKQIKRANDILKIYDDMAKKIDVYNLDKITKENVKIYYTNCVLHDAKSLDSEYLNDYLKELKKRKLYKNIKARNLKQLIKKVLLKINIKLYLKK